MAPKRLWAWQHFGKGWSAIRLALAGETAYVANASSGTVTPIQTTTGTAGNPISVGGPSGVWNGPDAIAITPNGEMASTSRMRARARSPRSRPPPGRQPNPSRSRVNPYAIAITPNGETAYVANYGSGTVTPIRTANNAAGKPIPVGNNPTFIAIMP